MFWIGFDKYLYKDHASTEIGRRMQTHYVENASYKNTAC